MESFKILHYEYVLNTCYSYFKESNQHQRLAKVLFTALSLIEGLESRTDNNKDGWLDALGYARDKLCDLEDKEFEYDIDNNDIHIDRDFLYDVSSYL